MSTPRIDRILGELVANGRELHEGSCPKLLVEGARAIESELEAAKARIAKLEKAGDAMDLRLRKFESAAVMKIADDGIAVEEWAKAKESKP